MKQEIEVYTVNIQRKGESENLNFSEDINVYQLMKNQFRAYVRSGEGRRVGYTEDRALNIPNDRVWGYDDQRQYVYGVIKSGKYGKKIEVAGKYAPNRPRYTSRDKDDAVMKPFFFLIFIPREGKTAFVVLERNGNESIRPVFQKLLTGFLNERRTESGRPQRYNVQFNNYLSREYVEGLRNGTIQSLTLDLNKLPADLADQYEDNFEREKVSLSLTVKFKGKGLDPDTELSKAIRERKTIFSNEAFSSFFDEGEAKIVTKSAISGVSKTRTVYLSDEAEKTIKPYYIVEVEQHDNGYSDYDSICHAVYEFIDDNEELSTLN